MSFFPRAFVGPNPSFAPLFRLLDDYDTYNNQSGGVSHHRSHFKSFHPKFDVKELADSYNLSGELPGIDQKDVEIEFTDAQTLTIHGRTEHTYTAGKPPTGYIEGTQTGGAITENGEGSDKKHHKATVEDEGATGDQTVTAVAQTEQSKGPEEKYWVSERSVGEFARSFSFPSPVDQEGVQASMKNGILSVVVPKAQKREGRKITIT